MNSSLGAPCCSSQSAEEFACSDATTYGAVAESDGTSELDEVSSTDGVERQEVEQVVNTVGDTVVGLKEGLNGWEEEHGAIGTSTAENSLEGPFEKGSYTYAKTPVFANLGEKAMASWKVSRRVS